MNAANATVTNAQGATYNVVEKIYYRKVITKPIVGLVQSEYILVPDGVQIHVRLQSVTHEEAFRYLLQKYSEWVKEFHQDGSAKKPYWYDETRCVSPFGPSEFLDQIAKDIYMEQNQQ